MSTQRTGYLEVPGFRGILEVREDGASMKLGGNIVTLPTGAPTLARTDSGNTFTGDQTIVGNELTTSGVGTVTTAATTVAVEHGDAIDHLTVLTMTSFALGTIPDNASLGIGNKFYTFPAGTILVEKISLKGGISTTVDVTTATPEVGIGSTIGLGAVSVLSGTGTFEDYMDGNTSGGTNGATVAPDIAGTVFYKQSRNNLDFIIKTSGGATRDLFLNAAAAWSDVTAAGVGTFTGTITIKWRIIG